ncbi:MAG: DUF3021 domain-containing protein [Coprobacillus sp.]|nr:DUF3021 domain-containing protein [Coprobacillus sp.]
MKHFKYFLTITCTSFTLVILINTILIQFCLSNLTLQPNEVLEIFIICLLIAGISVGMDFIPYFSDHLMISSYFIMIGVASGAEYILNQSFYWSDFFVEVCFLTLVYLGVWFCLYLEDDKKIQSINEEIEKRNQK